MKQYTLTKLRFKDNSFRSAVVIGESITGGRLAVHDPAMDSIHELTSISEVTEGVQVFVSSGFSFIRTSPIETITSRESNRIEFVTQTSVYELTETNEGGNS